MKTNGQSPITYKRGKVEISGEPKQTKPHIWYEQINASLLWIALVIILLCVLPKASWLPVVWQWLKKYTLLLIPLVVVADWAQLLLSG